MCYLVGMERIGVRELRQHATRYLGRVKAGETVEVTERGKLVALLVPPAPGATERERLIAIGTARACISSVPGSPPCAAAGRGAEHRHGAGRSPRRANVIYLDSSALLKLLHDEAESAALADWLTARMGTPIVSSALAKVEVVRRMPTHQPSDADRGDGAARRAGPHPAQRRGDRPSRRRRRDDAAQPRRDPPRKRALDPSRAHGLRRLRPPPRRGCVNRGPRAAAFPAPEPAASPLARHAPIARTQR